MKHKTVFLVSLLLFGSILYSAACTIIAIGKKASDDGSVIISHTDGGADSRIFVVHGSTFEPGAMAPVYLEIQDASKPLHDDG